MAALYPMGYNADFSQRTYDLRHAQEIAGMILKE
jgi:hypothetical protein